MDLSRPEGEDRTQMAKHRQDPTDSYEGTMPIIRRSLLPDPKGRTLPNPKGPARSEGMDLTQSKTLGPCPTT
jgi:hypothetical protein